MFLDLLLMKSTHQVGFRRGSVAADVAQERLQLLVDRQHVVPQRYRKKIHFELRGQKYASWADLKSLKVAEVEGQLQVNKIGEDKRSPIVFIDQLFCGQL